MAAAAVAAEGDGVLALAIEDGQPVDEDEDPVDDEADEAVLIEANEADDDAAAAPPEQSDPPAAPELEVDEEEWFNELFREEEQTQRKATQAELVRCGGSSGGGGSSSASSSSSAKPTLPLPTCPSIAGRQNAKYVLAILGEDIMNLMSANGYSIMFEQLVSSCNKSCNLSSCYRHRVTVSRVTIITLAQNLFGTRTIFRGAAAAGRTP